MQNATSRDQFAQTAWTRKAVDRLYSENEEVTLYIQFDG